MEQDQKKDVHHCTLKLLRYVLAGDQPDLNNDIDFNELFEFSFQHGIDNMIYMALQELGIDIPYEIEKKFSSSYNFAIRTEAVQAIAMEELTKAFNEEKIDYIPLKGIVIRKLYPMPDYRKSGDIDILIRKQDVKKINSIMLKYGYTLDSADEYELHRGYRKEPSILVEIHDRLVEKSNRSFGHLSKIWDSEEIIKSNCSQYEMSKELFYTFSIAHFCKHIKNGGAGIKFVADVFLMKKNWVDKFDNKKLCYMLEQCNLTQFDHCVNDICNSWFYSIPITNSASAKLEDLILSSGSFGTSEQARKLKKSVIAEGKQEEIKYKATKIYSGIFVKYESMRSEYPILTKHRILLPLFWCIRIIKILRNKDLLKEKIGHVYEMNKDEAQDLRQIWEMVR